jgi:hypothetical protein
MAELPGGTVTFLFTDVECSTELVKRLQERYAEGSRSAAGISESSPGADPPLPFDVAFRVIGAAP